MQSSSAASEIPLRDGWLVGRDAANSTVLDDPNVSRRHLAIHRVESGWQVEDLRSRGGSYLNGHPFERETLVLGDILRIGPYAFRFDGLRLVTTSELAGARLEARDLVKTRQETPILRGVSLSIAPCEFVGIIGPSGAGKTTLLDALCALRPPDGGSVFLDGMDLLQHYESLRHHLGYVPQDDIVPLELSVSNALFYSARLRLPSRTPRVEIERLVRKTIMELGLESREHTPVGQLSGGQRKRVSVGAELLGRPRLLFLDEPTSGLDPAAESRLMESLRFLAAGGCTVVCTTHVMENAHLMDRLLVIDAGRLIFCGSAGEARKAFDVPRLTQLYDRLEEGTAAVPEMPPSPPLGESALPPPPPPRPAALPVLLRRQLAILLADHKNLFLVFGQPVLIALMVTWVTDDSALILFFAMVSTLWFGCGNAAQEIVKELPMFRRERLIGLGRHEYLLSKFLPLSRITVLQSLLLYGLMQLFAGGIGGSVGWQMAGLIATSIASVGLGLAISALARSILQAVMLVPLVLIPQILFSGFTPPAGDMGSGPFWVSRLMPSASTQAIMDVSLFWDRKISGSLRVDFPTAFSNLNRDRSLRNGVVFVRSGPAWLGISALLAWTLATYGVAWRALRGKERG